VSAESTYIPAFPNISLHPIRPIIVLLLLFFIQLPSGASILSADIVSATAGSSHYAIDLEWGDYGDQPGQLDSIDDILISRDGQVYISDAGNHRVSIFSRNGTHLGTLGGWIKDEGFLFTPGSLAEDSKGTIYIPDSSSSKIERFTSLANRIKTIELPSKKGIIFLGPRGIAINSSGIIYVTQPVDNTILTYTDDGVPGRILNLPVQPGKNQYPGPIVHDREDNLYCIESGSGHLLKYNPQGNLTADWSPDDLGLIGGKIPFDICMGPDDNLYITSLSSNTIQIIDTTGKIAGQEMIPVSGIISPRIAISPQGEIFIGDSMLHRVYRILKTDREPGSQDQSETTQYRISLRVSPTEPVDHPVIHIEPEKVNVAGLNFPTHLLVTDDEKIFISSHNNHRVVCTTNHGTIIRIIDNSSIPDGRFNNPGGIAEDREGNLYIANQGSGRIERFSSAGKYLSSIGSHGSGAGQFIRPSGLAFGPDGSLYIADLGNNRVVRLSGDGRTMTLWGREGIEDGQFREPWDIAVGKDGTVYVTDSQNHRVQKFTPDGEWLMTWGMKGNDAGKFLIPTGMDVDADGNILVTDTNNYRVQAFTPDGELIHEIYPEKKAWASHLRIQGLALSPKGDIYLTDCTSSGSIIKIPESQVRNTTYPDGEVYVQRNQELWRTILLKMLKISPQQEKNIDELLFAITDFFSDVENEDQDEPLLTSYSISPSWGITGASSGSGMKPGGITTGPDGRIYSADYGNHRIRVFFPDGTPAFSWGEKGSGEGQLYNPSDLAIDNDGMVYVADTNNNRIQKFTNNGSFIRQWPIPARNQTHLCRPTGICVDEDGTVFVTDYANYQVYRFAPDGTEQYHWGVQGTIGGHLMGPYGIAVNDHQVYITDMLSPGVKVYDDQGNYITSWNNNDSSDGTLKEPQGISIDKKGTIFVADRADNRIIRYSPRGQVLSVWENPPSSGLTSPVDVWPLPDGTILVSDFGNGRIIKIEGFPVREESLSDQYWKFSKSVDDWWNRTWSEINAWE